LQQQALQRIQASQGMPRDGVRQSGAQHYKLMLPFGFRRSHGTPYGVIESAKLALSAAIHIAHANHNGMGLIVQVQAVRNQLLQFDISREPAIKGPSTAATWPAFVPSFWASSTFTTATFTTATRTAIVTTRTTTTLRTIPTWRAIPAGLAAVAMLSH